MAKIPVTPQITIDEDHLQYEFVRASGPGGQKVNKTASAVQLRYELAASGWPEPLLARLRRLAGKRVTGDDVLVIDARRFRTQERNRQDALDRLVDLVRRAAQPPKARRKTRPTRSSVEKRLRKKQRRSEKKRLRGKLKSGEE